MKGLRFLKGTGGDAGVKKYRGRRVGLRGIYGFVDEFFIGVGIWSFFGCLIRSRVFVVLVFR